MIQDANNKLRILVVDDELVSRKKMVRLMEEFGTCVSVESGCDALRSVGESLRNKEPFDLICLDVGMEDISGDEVMFRIRELEQRYSDPIYQPHAKVIMVTANCERDTVVNCITAGCDDYLVKPVDIRKLVSSIEKLGL